MSRVLIDTTRRDFAKSPRPSLCLILDERLYLLLYINTHMAKKERNGRRKNDEKVPKKINKASQEETSLFSGISFLGGLSDEIRHSVIAILFFVIGIFFSVAPWGYAGLLGGKVYNGFEY